MTKTNITVFIEVYNEEARIESCLKNFSWADQIVVFDKNSSDRTKEIAEKYATDVISVPYGDASENVINNISQHPCSEWCLFPTASSLIHPELVREVVKLTSNPSFSYDVIGMPLGFYSLGIRSKLSPFGSSHKHILIRRTALVLSNKLHHEVSYDSKKIYDIPYLSHDAVLYHCTHKNIESYIPQIARYTRYESENDISITQYQAFKDIVKAFLYVLIRRKTILLGWDGVALSLAYISYYVFRFLFVWEKRRSKGDEIYSQLREALEKEWSRSEL